MKKMAGFLLTVLLAGAAWGQPPQLIQKIKDKFKAAPQPPSAAQGQVPKNAPAAPAGSATKPASAAAVNNKAASKPPASKAVATPQAGNPAPAKVPSSTASVAPSKAAGSKGAAAGTAKSGKPAPPPTKIAIAPVAPQPKQGAQKAGAGPFARRNKKQVTKLAAAPKQTVNPTAQKAESASVPENKERKVITAEGRRDPFLSPIVSSPTGPGCSTGKRCLAIDQIIVRGVVKADAGMIAVVVNSLNKAYFLKENDPVFNGYVMKITGDSVVFRETYQDKLGKEFTREVIKKITTPAV